MHIYTQGIIASSNGQNVSLGSLRNPSRRYKEAWGGQVNERGAAADWRAQLRCTSCITTHLNDAVEPLLRELTTADVLLGSCSAFSYLAAALGEGVAILPASLFTVRGYAGVLSMRGMDRMVAVPAQVEQAVLPRERFKALLDELLSLRRD